MSPDPSIPPLLTADPAPNPPVPRTLSTTQRRLWLLRQLDPHSAAYHVCRAVWIEGCLETPPLRAAIEQLLHRHEALRMRFWDIAGEAVSCPLEEFELPLREDDLSDLRPEEWEEAARAGAYWEAARPFALEAGQPFRVLLIRGVSRALLVLTAHHLVCDGWSFELLKKELGLAYSCFRRGERLALEPIEPSAPVDSSSEESLERCRAYWEALLTGAAGPPRLPGERHARAGAGDRPSVRFDELDPGLTNALNRLAAGEGSSLFAAILSGLFALTHRLTGQEDLVIGIPVANRGEASQDGRVAFLINTVAIRVRVESRFTFRGLLREVQRQLFAAMEHQQLPFDRVVEAIRPARCGEPAPLFDLFLNGAPFPEAAPELDEVTVTGVEAIECEARYPITIHVTAWPQRTGLRTVFDRTRYPEAQIQTLLNQLDLLLRQSASAPDAHLEVHSLVTSGCRAVLPNPAEPLARPVYARVPEQFEGAASRHPHEPALKQGSEVWTYAELAGEVRALADGLHAAGVQSGEVVAVSGPRSAAFVAAVLATLRVGGVLLTLDPVLPEARQALMLHEAGARWRLDSGVSCGLEAVGGISLAAQIAIREAPQATDIPSRRHDPDAAYIFFTSGTSGTPRGVLGSHQALSQFLDWQRGGFGVSPGDRCGQLTALSFDVLLRDLLLPLTSGATLCLPPVDSDLDPAVILPWLAEERVTLLHLVPSLAACWSCVSAPHPLPDLRLLFLAGEPLTGSLVRQWHAAFPGSTQVVNLYGPTETTLARFFYGVPREIPDGALPVGRPIPSTQALVLNHSGQLCGVGEPGEVVIRTPFCSHGYVNGAPEENRRFRANPFTAGEYDRVYWSGDQGRYAPDGDLVLLGRRDRQAKIRGQRFQPEEIEAVLLAQEGIAAAAVSLWESPAGEPELAAYLIGGRAAPHADRLRAQLRRQLPAALVPTQLLFVPSLPLTPNGKLDRRLLPPPPRPSSGGSRPPAGAVETAIARAFCEVLRVAQVGADDDFFQLGGHSLLAIRAAGRLRELLGIPVRARAIFEAPRVAELALHLDRTDLTAQSTAGRSGVLPPTTSAGADGTAPTTPSQEALWLHQQAELDSDAYHLASAYRITGALDLTTLRSSLQQLAARHDTLRTAFVSTPNGLRQQLRSLELPVEMVVEDARPNSGEDRREAGERFLRELTAPPFRLDVGPLIRCGVRQTEDDGALVALVVHHLAADARSIRLLWNDLARFYSADVSGGDPGVDPLPARFVDYARETARLQSENAPPSEQGRNRVAEPLAGSSVAPDLDGARSGHGPAGRVAVHVSAYQVERIRQCALREEATLSMALAGLFVAALSLDGGQDEIVIGCPMTGRHSPATQELVGYFVHLVPLRVSVSSRSSFSDVLGAVRRTWISALDDARLAPELTRGPGTSGYDAVFAFDLEDGEAPAFRGLQAERCPTPAGRAKFDLLLSLELCNGAVSGHLEFDSSRLRAGSAARVARRFGRLGDAVVAKPEGALAALPLLSTEECDELEHWAGSPEPPVPLDCLHRLFREQASHTPYGIALSWTGGSLSYSELDERSTQLARQLVRLGARRDGVVALTLGRSSDLIVGLLAVLKAGAAYLAIEPGEMPERVAWMLADSGASLLIVDRASSERFGECGTPRAAIEDLMNLPADPEPEPPTWEDDHPHQLAYLAYTSGSTGQPKGVAVSHGAAVRLALGTACRGIDSGDGVLQFAPVAFDASTFEIWGALLNGARLEIFPPHLPTLHALGEFIRGRSVTVVWLTSGLFHSMVDQQLDCLTGVRRLLAGGDVLSRDHVMRAAHALPACELINGYGPTENTTFTCLYRANPVLDEYLTVPIGRPIAGTRVYVLNDHLEPVAPGAVGELYTAGDGLARGYHGAPGLTADRFLPDPFSPELGGRMYRTGDRARFLPDGNLEFLGRRDRQVKLRGFRIEPAQIEAALRRHPEIDDAVVEVVDNGRERLLAAHLRANGSARPDRNELSSFLAGHVPAHEIPGSFTWLDSFPLTPNGKVDRRALPRPQFDPVATVAPRTREEEAIAAIWGEALGLPVVGVTDDFFELGGHSLLAMRVSSRIELTLRLSCPLRLLFECRTIETLAARLAPGDLDRTAGRDAPPPLRPAPHGSLVPCSPSQRQLWFLDRLEPDGTAYHVASALRLRGPLDAEALHAALRALVARHEALRTTLVEQDDEPFQRIAPSLDPELPLQDFSQLPASEREAALTDLLTREGRRPFSLSTEPLLRCLLVRLTAEEHVFVLTLHHVIADGWSIGVLFRELEHLYAAASSGAAPRLPELPVQFADYALWLQSLQGRPETAASLDYWRRTLADLPALLPLQPDHSENVQGSTGAGHVPVHFDPALTQRLAALTRSGGATLFSAITAAFAVLLYRHTGQSDLVFGTPVAGRSDALTEGIVGFLAGTVVLRTDLSGNPGFPELLRRVHQTVTGAVAHSGAPFESVVKAVNPERAAQRQPLFRMMVALNNTPGDLPHLAGLEVSAEPTPAAEAKFDLSLLLEERGGELSGVLEYDRRTFSAAAIEPLAARFAVLLASIVRSPETSLSRLSVLPEAERTQLLDAWAVGPALREGGLAADGTAGNANVVDRFLTFVDLRPENPAVSCDGETWSYSTLDRRSQASAGRLAKAGVRPGMRVGICCERSAAMVAAVIAVLRSGCTYVPLDPGYPAARLSQILLEADLAVVLTDAGEDMEGVPGLSLHPDTGDPDAPPAATPSIHPELPAYVMFTSGSTGTPKGIPVPHRAVWNFLRAMTEALEVSETDHVLALTTLSFDISVLELLVPLVTGAQLTIVDRRTATDGAALSRVIDRAPLTLVQATPSTWRLLEAAGWSGKKGLTALSGGEPLPADLAAWLRSRCDRVWNMYGPTETTVWSTVHRVASDEGRVSIGRPIANTQVYVLDEALEPLPAGAPGELYIAGHGLAAGYVGRAGLTADRFRPDPFSTVPGARMYATGDLVRYRPDGSLEWLGRTDHQVKIRGVRLELGEIEAALAAHPKVARAVALVREDTPGDPRLVAYAVPTPENTLDAAELRSFLNARLPSGMLPSLVVPLDSLPLTPNRKVDRKALPAPEAYSSGVGQRLPATPVEALLLAAFREVLRAPEMGLDESFFDRGGHSLLAVRLMARIEREVGRKLPIAVLFQAPTPSRLAELLTREGWQPSWTSLVALRPQGSRPPLFFVHGVGGTLLCYRDLCHHLPEEQPFYGLQAPGLDGSNPEYFSIEELASRYIAEIRTVQPHGPYYLGGLSFGGIVALEMAHQLVAAGEEVPFLAFLDTPGPGYPQFRSFVPRILAHAGNMLRLKPQQQFAYVARRAAAVRETILRGLWRKSYLRHMEAGRVLPQELHDVGLALRNARWKYDVRPFSGTLTFFRAAVQPVGCHPDPYCGWKGYGEQGVEVIEVPGEHGSIVEEPFVPVLAQRLEECLRKLPRGTG